MSEGQISDLSTLVLPDGTISVDEINIHDCLTERMENCFRQNTSPQLDAYLPYVVPPHSHISGWERAISEPGYIINHPNLQYIPLDLLEVIEYAFQSNRTNSALITDMSAAFADDNPITIAEFEAQIKGCSNDKSPGLTGFTINMMKKLPVECREYIYHLISTFWTFGSDNHIPSFWKDRFLALIPKDKNKAISADRVRPISLYEVTRKIWTGAIMKRITNLWDRHKAVNDTQNAYRRHKGVDLPVLQVINAVQNILADSTELLCSSYDIQQCFDSVNRPLVIASYMRLGVPKHIARSLVLLDIDGATIIRTSHSIKSLARGRQHLSTLVEKSDHQTAKIFIARDGIGQGDKTAAPSFTAISDIENVALERLHTLAVSRGVTTTSCLPVLFPLGNQFLKAIPPIIYADDKNILSNTFEHAQLAADIISGFSCIAGFTQNFKKFRYGAGSWNGPLPPLILHDKDWNAIPIAPEIPLKVRILGVDICLLNHWSSLQKESRTLLTSSLGMVNKRKVPVGAKIMYFSMKIIPTVAYRLQFTSISLVKTEKLTRLAEPFLRSALNLLPSHPSANLYMCRKHFGMQVPNLTNIVQIRKLGILFRALTFSISSAETGTAIIEQVYNRASISIMLPRASIPLPYQPKQTLWIDSLLQWLSEMGITLSYFSPLTPQYIHSSSPLLELLDNVDDADELARWDIREVYDVTIPFIDAENSTHIRREPINHGINMLLTLPDYILHTPHTLQIGEVFVWGSNSSRQYLIEFRGAVRMDNKWCYTFRELRLNQAQYKRPAPGLNYSFFGTTCVLSDKQIVMLTTRVLIRTSSRASSDSIKIINIIQDLPPCPLVEPNHHKYDQTTHEAYHSPYFIFTDGSVVTSNSMSYSLLGPTLEQPDTIQAASSVIMYDSDLAIQDIRYVDSYDSTQLPGLTPYLSEAIGIIAAILLVKSTHHLHPQRSYIIYTDCKGLSSKMIKGIAYNRILNPDPFLSYIVQTSKALNISFCWIRSHPERRQPDRSKWTFLERGNNMADVIASGCLASLSKQLATYDKFYSTYNIEKDIVPLLFSQARYTLTYNGIPISLQQIIHIRRHKTSLDYLMNRSNTSTRGINWMSLTYSLSYMVVSKLNYTASRVSKTIFEKYMTDQYLDMNVHQCHLCQMDSDIMQHLITCPSNSAISLRQHARATCDNIPIMDTLDHLRFSMNVIRQNINRIMKTEYMAWYGLFSPSTINDIFANIRLSTLVPLISVRKQIRMWLAPWAEAAFNLISLRNSSKMSYDPKASGIDSESISLTEDEVPLHSSVSTSNDTYEHSNYLSPTTQNSYSQYVVLSDTIIYCDFGDYSSIVLQAGIDIREQLCEHLSIPHQYITEFDFLRRSQYEHLVILPNDSTIEEGVLCKDLANQSLLCLQWRSSPIKRHKPCYFYLADIPNIPLKLRTTTYDETSFYYSLGIGILQTMVCQHMFNEIVQLCSDLLDEMKELLAYEDHFTIVMIWRWIEYLCDNSAHTDLIDYSLEFLISFDSLEPFSLPHFCLLLGKLLVIRSLREISESQLIGIQMRYTDFGDIKNPTELSRIILYPEFRSFPFHQDLLSESFLRQSNIALSIYDVNGDLEEYYNPALLGNQNSSTRIRIRIYYCDELYGLINAEQEFEYSTMWEYNTSAVLRLHFSNENLNLQTISDEVVFIDSFIRETSGKYNIDIATSGHFHRLDWSFMAESQSQLIIPQQINGCLFLLELNSHKCELTLYSSLRPEWRGSSRDILTQLLMDKTSQQWHIIDCIIPEYNNCLALSICYHIVQHFGVHLDPVYKCQEFVSSFAKNEHTSLHIHPLVPKPVGHCLVCPQQASQTIELTRSEIYPYGISPDENQKPI